MFEKFTDRARLDAQPTRALEEMDAIALVAESCGIDVVELARFVRDHRTTE